MLELIETNHLVWAGIVLLIAVVVWWMWGRSKAAPAKREYTDVLSEGAAPATRNNALIAAPSAVTMAGVGEIVAHAATDEVAEAAPVGAGDDLSRIKGVGPKLKALLASLGVTSFAQIAGWSDEDIARIDAQLGSFAGRAVRDNWVEQAKLLASGDAAAYEAKFGKI
ncbi:hypothetical protein IP81_03335 [Novosphingobium sp. AAP83]|uniref:hypothetical protein n=1 Tax=Novosphingobium sp. AAP83 TaxID=1523425 RepID=UPI0006B88CFD|nr:hypothetical protein [Novosphingobium sp. AAP83]KPF93276.1 hypothetical protein IP81_03335 [Novosphingobium sp. AAP83]